MNLPLNDVDLPHGWTCRQVGEEAIRFRHPESGLAVTATKTDAIPPRFDVLTGWRLVVHQQAGEYTNRKPIGCVTTRSAALDGLFSYMECVAERFEQMGKGINGMALAETVALRNEVPTTGGERSSDSS